ncbi:ABC1 kinase family protein [Gorillibacterium massiliense]|uniref:ABC1 kinase family protein n=1 Tax=Gorillibacterium massiliense TaxID=1280390 RepID=UPI001EE31EF6|nr:AarF/ABC1/UbiB kinase family protein [Gorillibacterium massiliense]
MSMLMRFVLQYWFLSRGKRFMSKERAEAKMKALFRKQAARYTKTAVELGGLLIKLGQHVSARIDILPKEYTDELSKLQDSVAPVATAEVILRMETELGRTVGESFAEFDHTPIAAASLGQVYKATLRTGEKVAVKVLRPGIERIIATDLDSLRIGLKFLGKKTKVGNLVDLDALYDEFYVVLSDELDYYKEGESAERIQLNFIANDEILVPKIYWDFTTHKVLTMEFLDGVKINELDRLDEWGIDRHKLAKNLYEIYMQQIIVDGFFHADPHPGNVLVQKDGTIALVDYGMMGSISEKMKNQIVALIMAVYLKDSKGAIDALFDLGFLRKNADVDVLSKSLTVLFEQIMGGKVQVDYLGDEAMLEEFREFLYSQPFQLPSNTTFLGKAAITVYGLCSALDKDFDFIENGKPYIEDIMTDDLKSSTFKNILGQGKQFLKGIIPSTKKFVSAIEKIDSGSLKVKLPSEFEERLIETQIRNTSRIVSTIIGAVLFITGAQWMGGQHQDVSPYLMALGGLMMLLQMRSKSSKMSRRAKRMQAMSTNAGMNKPKFHP